MSHDTEAAYAYGEIARDIQARASSFFGSIGSGGTWALSGGRENRSRWPLADGIIQATNSRTSRTSNYDKNIAFEYKRPNEGLHGVLTAIGQAYSYIDKGYDASVICIPRTYSSHNSPGAHAKQIIETNTPDAPIVIYTYNPPNLANLRPFAGKLQCVRDIDLSACRQPIRTNGANVITPSISTVWAHVREGESFPDAFFRYCQCAKIASSVPENRNRYRIIQELKDAVYRIDPNANVINYLSYTNNDSMLDKAWRMVWYKYYLCTQLQPIYNNTAPYTVNNIPTRIRKNPNDYMRMFSGRSDSIKEQLVQKLNGTFIPAGSTTPVPPISQDVAWEEYARKIRNTAHSYREVIDSGLEQLGLIDSDGNLTDYGYLYVNACEKASDDVYDETPMTILRGVTLQLGQYDIFLSTFYKYSNEHFKTNFNSFTKMVGTGNPTMKFDAGPYLQWMNNIFVNDLHMLKTSTLRAGGTRKPFQAELSYLKSLELVDSTAPYKIGTGLNINWPLVESSMLSFQSL